MRRSVSSPDETLRSELKIRRACLPDIKNTTRILLRQNDFRTEEEIKDAKMSSFSSDLQTLIKH